MKIGVRSLSDYVVLAECFSWGSETMTEYDELERKYGPNFDSIKRLVGEHHPVLYPVTYGNERVFYIAVIAREQGTAKDALNFYVSKLKLKMLNWENSPLEREIKNTLVCLGTYGRTIPYCFN